MSNFQNAFLVTITEENGTYHYKKPKTLISLHLISFYQAFFLCCKSHYWLQMLHFASYKAFYTYQASIRAAIFFSKSFEYSDYGMTHRETFQKFRST